MSPSRGAATPAAGWRVVFACFMSALFAWGFGFYAHGIYLVQLQAAHGWSTGLISSIVTAHYILGALLLPRIVEAIGRFGPGAVMLSGIAATSTALLLLPAIDAPWQLALLFVVMAAGWNATSVAPIASTIGQWFDRQRGLALNLALSGATAAGLIVAPALLAAIATFGFTDALRLLVLAGLVLAGGAVAAFVRRGPAQPSPTGPASNRWAPLKTWRFWSISAPFALVLIAQVGFLTHLVPLVADRPGVDPGFAIAVNAFMALVGRVVLGFIIDRLSPRPAAALSFLVQVGAIAVLGFAETPSVIYGACAVYGFSVGNNITLSPLIVQREYAGDDFPRIVALSTAMVQILYAFGPGLLGILRDAFGSYGVPLAVCIALNLVASGLILLRPRPA
jgi:MFS family permease